MVLDQEGQHDEAVVRYLSPWSWGQATGFKSQSHLSLGV